jgi:hypothetical protein
VDARFSAELWQHDGEGSWHFLSLPPGLSDDLRARGGTRRGFGSLRVRVTVGGSTWATSVFPAKEGVYVLPVKRPVRTAEGVEAGDVVEVTLEVLD